jgi:CheY-like chemotaxis protein
MSAQGRSGWRILVVDDEPAVCQLAAECIRLALGEEHEVRRATSGEDAMREVSLARPDLILLDIMMPGMDGFAVCRQLKESPLTGGIPVVFLTARGDAEAIEQGLALGGDGYVVKPFNAVTLAAQISELLSPQEG